MSKSKKNVPIERDKTDQELELIRARAGARAILEDPEQPPPLLISFVKTRVDEVGAISPIECNARRAVVKFPGASYIPGLPAPSRPYEKEIIRNADESLEEFKERVWKEMPATGPSITVLFSE